MPEPVAPHTQAALNLLGDLGVSWEAALARLATCIGGDDEGAVSVELWSELQALRARLETAPKSSARCA